MKNHPFKNFIPYAVAPVVLTKLRDAYITQVDGTDENELLDALVEREARDPGEHDWRSFGFVPPLSTDESLLVSPTMGIYHLAIQFNERILPAKVRDEHVAKRIAAIEERDGRRIHKKEYAQVRDEVQFELLPKAFIKRPVVHVLFVLQRIFIFTASAKICDDIFILLRDVGLTEGAFLISGSTVERVTGLLDSLATEAQERFEAAAEGTFKLEKQTIKVKDRDIYGHEVQEIVQAGYTPKELRINMLNEDDDEALLTFTLNEKFVFKRVQISDVALESAFESQDQDDNAAAFQAFTIIMAGYCQKLVNTVIDELGGIELKTKPDDKKAEKPVEDDEDEL